MEGESNGCARRGRRRRRGSDLGNFAETRSTTATVPPGEAYKASLVRHCGPTVPLGMEAKEAVQLNRFFLLGLIWPSRPERCATFEFERIYSGSGGSSLRRQRRVPRAQDDGRVLGPLWPTSLAIAPAALPAIAAGTMPGGYCRKSGTWGSPDDAKVRPTPWAHQEGKQDTESRQEMGHPISS